MATMTLDQYLESRGLNGEAAIEKSFQDALALLPLAALRDAAGLTQANMAKAMGQSQAAVSKLEGRGDFLLSTLYRYVGALKGNISLQIQVGDEHFSVAEAKEDGEMFFRLSRKSVQKRNVQRSERIAVNIHSLRKFSSLSGGRQHVYSKAFPAAVQGNVLGKRHFKASNDFFNPCKVSSDEAKPIAA